MSAQVSRVRIIGGQWRRRGIALYPGAAIRPTPVRLRETLFNWLMPFIAERHCLDLFAGSGALGFEALSRGAQSATMVDQQQAACTALKHQAALFNAGSKVKVIRSDALQFLIKVKTPVPYDLVFLDPPFGHGLLGTALKELGKRYSVMPGSNAIIYIEYKKNAMPAVPPRWKILRETTVAGVGGALLRPSLITISGPA